MSPLSSPLIAPLASGLGIRITGTSMQDNIRNPGVQTASVMAFLERFPDVDILFPLMDTSIEARCLGCPSEFGDRVPVVTAHPFPDPDAVCGLAVPDPLSSTPMATSIEVASRLSRETGRKTASFVVGPVTLAAHLMGPTALVKTALRDPAGFGRVLDHCSWLIRPYAEALAAAGASHLVVLEPQLIFFSPAVYVRSARERIEGLCSGLPSPVLHVCGDTTRHLEELGRTANVEALSLDAAVDLPSALDMIPGAMTLMGNIGPVDVLLRGTPELVRDRVKALMKSMEGSRFILSSGCDMVPDTPLENLDALIRTTLALRR